MYYVCKGCDNCCRSCCRCCEECCGECCDAISNCFSTPFSFCTFITFFVSIIPFIIMIVALIQSSDFDCQENIKTYLIIQGINNLINFLFCLYITFHYGYYGKYQVESKKTFWEQTVDLILYDWFVCIYIFALIFFVIWLIICFSAANNEPEYSPCRQENNGFLMTALTINLICMIVYLIVGFLIFIITVILYSCDDGSCSCGGCFRCCCLVITCGMCDFGKDKKKYSKEYTDQRKAQYNEGRKGWLQSGKRLFGFLSLGRANPRMNQMNTNMDQQQQQQYYQPQQQQQQQYQRPVHQDRSFFDKLSDCFKGNDNNNAPQQRPQPQQYQQQVYIQQQPNIHQANNYQQPYQYQQQPYQQQQYSQPAQYQPNYQYPQQQQNGWGK
ncbi:unnamed protein product [Paramecium pentaurelia]|uniref:Transmembrane protein n=1 Tax=Paramecium pentaurelia TaxID=43138 RepID=A0A8S1SRB0_9CILI|nr:unnamed protein product [Paramecium pentaurelia]